MKYNKLNIFYLASTEKECCRLPELDIMYSPLKFFINTSRYTANTTNAPAAAAPDHLKLTQRPHGT